MQSKKLSKNKVDSIINKKDWTYVPGPRMGTNNFMYGVELGTLKTSKKVKIVTQGKKNGF
jgi:hypothetical protein